MIGVDGLVERAWRVYEPSTTSADGVSIGEPRSERVQTDLDEKVTGEWNEQEVAVQSVSSLIVPA